MTRHISILVALFVGAWPTVTAQAVASVSAGHVSARLDRSVTGTEQEVAARRGLAFGGGLRWRLHGSLGIAAEVLAVTKGGREPGGEASLRFDYLELPVGISLEKPQGKLRPFATIGPVAAIMLRCTLQGGGGVRQSCDQAYGPADGFAPIDLGVMAEVGIRMGRSAIGLRRDHGLRDIDDAPGYRSRNRAWLLLVSADL